MNPITYSLNKIIGIEIPKQILKAAFTSKISPDWNGIDTIENRIRDLVIEPFVLTDCNLVGGTQVTVPLRLCTKISGSYYNAVYQVPEDLVQGKRITSVLNRTIGPQTLISTDLTAAANSSGVYATINTGINSIGGGIAAATQMFNSVQPVRVVSNALTYLVGHNAILIKDSVQIPGNMILTVRVENDSNFNHVPSDYWPDFHKMCVWATKMYIYNLLVIEQDNAFIISGGELGTFKSIVDGYTDAKELYEESLDNWAKMALLMDPESSRRHYSAVTGGGH